MSCPVNVQRFEVYDTVEEVGVAHAYPAQSSVLHADGVTAVVDLLDIAPWAVFRLACRAWTLGSSAVPGCLTVQDPARLGAS